MTVPKAAVNKYHLPPAWKYEVGFTWQVSAVQPESVTHSMGEATHEEFGLSVLALNGPHDTAP